MTEDIKHETLNFTEALLLTHFGQVMAAQSRAKRLSAPVVKMTFCHDGVFRVLQTVPKFKPGCIMFDPSHFMFSK